MLFDSVASLFDYFERLRDIRSERLRLLWVRLDSVLQFSLDYISNVVSVCLQFFQRKMSK